MVSTDSRSIAEGAIFFALRGKHFDGNRYARQAMEKGASLAVIDDPLLENQEGCVLVENVLQTLQALATHHRQQFDIPVLGITGSNGKTTTKELITRVMQTSFRTHATSGNLNNHIGVPLTLLSMPPETEFAVIEMGANHQGEIAALSAIAQPNFGLITNIGKAHLEGFGGIQGVKKGKSELYRHLAAHEGKAFVNGDEPFLEELSAGVPDRLIYREGPGQENGGLGSIQAIRTEPAVAGSFATGDGNRQPFESHLMGRYNFNNIMTAIVLGRYFEVPADRIALAVSTYLPDNNRSQVLAKGDRMIFLDAYNANPSSMQAALDQFARQPGHPKWVILGSMLELGDDSQWEHHQLARQALRLGFNRVLLVGDAFRQTAKELNLPYFEGVDDLRPWLLKHLPESCTLMVKGSRKNKLEEVVEGF